MDTLDEATGQATTIDPREALQELLFRASVDEPFRQTLLVGDDVHEIAAAYDVDPALLATLRFVEAETDDVDEIVLPRRIEEGTTLTTAELSALLPSARGTVAMVDTCWFTSSSPSPSPSPTPSPTPSPSPSPSPNPGPGTCWFTGLQ